MLEDDNVDEVIVQSGQAIRTVKGFTERAVPSSALTASEIVGMLQAGQLQHIVPRQDTAGEEHTAAVDGREFRFRIARFLDLIELRICHASLEDENLSVEGAADANEDTVIVTAPKGQARQSDGASSTATVQLRHAHPDPLPAPTRHPIGPDDPTVPLAVGAPPPETQTRRDTPEVAAPLPPAATEPEPEPELAAATRRDTPAVAPQGPPTRREPAVKTTPVSTPSPAPVVLAETTGAAEPAAVIHSDSEATVTPAVAALLELARSRGASDVHLMSDEAPRMRVAGNLVREGDVVPEATLREAVDALLAEYQQAILADRGYVDLGLTDPRVGRLRVNVCRQRRGLKLCARLVAPAPSTPTELGLPWEVEAIANHHQGLVICSGPSGAGKSTTLAALVQLFNERRPVHIITVEDPVEVQYPIGKAVVSQREVGTHTLSFARALEGALREDPDIIAIGELRDRETVRMALSASETGHLVIATMCTPSGSETIDRLIDMFPPEDQGQVRATLAGALKLVVSQRLIETPEADRRVAAFEVITGNVPLWSLIRDKKLHQLPSLLQRGRAYGMVRLEDSLRGLMLSKTITRQAAMAHASDPKLLGANEQTAPPSRRARAGSR